MDILHDSNLDIQTCTGLTHSTDSKIHNSSFQLSSGIYAE